MHNIPLGSIVELDIDDLPDDQKLTGLKGKARLFVVAHGYDCDGTPLYSLAINNITPPKHESSSYDKLLYNWLVLHTFHNYSEEALRVVGYKDPQSFEEALKSLQKE